jgi:hypothetical protein
MPEWTRRQLLGLMAATAAVGPRAALDAAEAAPLGDLRRNPASSFDWRGAGQQLRRRFPNLSRHFAFEYYPWYDTSPWRHWDQWNRRPPGDIAASSWPELGPYSSVDARVVERHARWIVDSGVGTVNLSWWGRITG